MSSLSKKRECTSKTAIVRTANIKGMPQLGVWNNIYPCSRCAFSAAFNQQLQPHFRTGASLAAPSPSSGGCCAQLLLPSHSTHSSVHRGFPSPGPGMWKAARSQQGLCSQFFTIPLLQAQHLKLCLCWCGCFQRDQKCSTAISKQNKSIFSLSVDTDSTFQMGKKSLN